MYMYMYMYIKSMYINIQRMYTCTCYMYTKSMYINIKRMSPFLPSHSTSTRDSTGACSDGERRHGHGHHSRAVDGS